MLRCNALLCAGLLALGCAGTGGSDGAEDPQKVLRNPFVRISNASLSPTSARVQAGGRVTFVNISSYLAVILLEASRSDFTCSRVGPDFEVHGDALRSTPIGSGGNQLTLPCPMKTGEYAYRVQLSAGIYGIGNQHLEYAGQLHFEPAKGPEVPKTPAE